MKVIWKEPLVYFFLLSSLLFLGFSFFEKESDNTQEIIVDRASLLGFIQQKAKVVEQDKLIKMFEAMPEDKRSDWINAYVKEEALYREAQALRLDENDPIIKGRVIQKLEFITKEYSEAILNVTQTDLTEYFDNNQKDYYIEPFVTFTHVFINGEDKKKADLLDNAKEKLNQLQANKVPFSQGAQHGDRFPYHVNYVERTPDFIASHFGQNMSDKIFALKTTSDIWLGPFESEYGAHLVMVNRLEPGRFPELKEVSGQVYQDLQRQKIQQNLDKSYQVIIDTYSVKYVDI
ncbi:MAG: peptidylprolyl isomerase [Colwellia sp.]